MSKRIIQNERNKEIAELEIKLSKINERKQFALNEYNNKIAEIEEDKLAIEKRLRQLINIE